MLMRPGIRYIRKVESHRFITRMAKRHSFAGPISATLRCSYDAWLSVNPQTLERLSQVLVLY